LTPIINTQREGKMNIYSKGSEWRKWDLHVHTKGTMKNDRFKSKTFGEFCVSLLKKALEKEIAAIGITDYFNIKNYKKVKEFVSNVDSCTDFTCEEKKKIKHIFILPNVELRMMPVTDSSRLVNIHCLFNPDYECFLENNFFGNLNYSAGTGEKYTMNDQGMIDLGKSLDPSLDNDMAYKKGIDSFVVTHSDLQKLLDENKRFRENVIVAVSNSNKDGASAFQKHYDLFEDDAAGSLDAVRKSIYSISDCIFSSNEKDINYFSGLGKDNKEDVKKKCGSIKPCIHGSDAHTEDKLFSPDQDKFCWIKADPTFEGLKQIIYEVDPGERVKISPVMPDQKDSYKVIQKIKFTNTNDFPEEIEFNQNLCSIIGSRSSGKSALLAYVAHAVDAKKAESLMKDGPGEGEDYHWDKIKFEYLIEWCNGKTSNENIGKIVYIPQNHLFEKSKDPDEIKEKIKPVLFKRLPDFELNHIQTENNIDTHNLKILEQVDNYFEFSKSINSLDEQLKNLGNKNAIEKEKREIQLKIKKLKEKNRLSENEIRQYQEIITEVSSLDNKIKKIDTELSQLSHVSEERNFFNTLKITLSPALSSLPKELQDRIKESLEKAEDVILEEVNKQVIEYKTIIEREKKGSKENASNIKIENNALIEKYQKNIELEGLITKINDYTEILKKITGIKIEKKNEEDKLKCCVEAIKMEINQRKLLIEKLTTSLENSDQSALGTIKFKVENGFDDNIEEVMQKINIRDKSDFIENRQLKINYIRENPGKFLHAVYSGEQKVIAGNDRKSVSRDTLSLTEKILFTAEMEGDQIGGFSEPTMTPGKRALFLLKLILAESEDTWPLLIDQPEDDLDSRSIYDDIVPFLKKKKKERQIIMVSHDANLVIGSDSEQVIVANRHGTDRENEDRKQFNYLTGSLECSKKKDRNCKDTLKSQGICEHSCDILDGGKIAFEQRKNKYKIK